MVYAGTGVTEGSATAVVTATGRHTELGRIRALVAETSAPSTPLERQLEQAGRWLVGLALGACAGVLGLGLLRGVPGLEMLRSAVSLAVAAVPEGLPAVATTTLALGVDRMMRRGTLVRRLAAVESLGAITVICVDKTGTLTENRMTVDSWWAGGREYGRGAALAAERASDPALARAMSIAVLCNEAELAAGDGTGMGSSTESALLEAALEAGVDYRVERRRYPLRSMRSRRDGQPWMATIHPMDPESTVIMMKGAPEQVLARADAWIRDGRPGPLTAADKREIAAMNDGIAARGLRMLALAFKTVRAREAPSYHGFVLAGLVALTDPIRPGVPAAIRACRTAGIRPVVLTGDHARTAAAVYGELGRGYGHASVFDASHVGELGAEELRALVREVDVFARVSPRDKYRIVRALQGRRRSGRDDGRRHQRRRGPAGRRHRSRHGRAGRRRGPRRGRRGAGGRRFRRHRRRDRAGPDHPHQHRQIAAVPALHQRQRDPGHPLGGLALGIARPMSAIQFPWINLLSDVAPALALAVEPAEADVMTRRPRDPAAPMLARSVLLEIGRDASMLAATALAGHGIGLGRYGPGPRSTSVAFSTLTTAQLLHALTYRSGPGAAGSRVLLGTVAGTIGLQVGAMTLPPLRGLLGLTPLGLADWGLVLGGATLPFIAKEIGRRSRTV